MSESREGSCDAERLVRMIAELGIEPSIFRRTVRLYPCLAQREGADVEQTCLVYSKADAAAFYGNSLEQAERFPIFERRDDPKTIQSIRKLPNRFPVTLASEIYAREYWVNAPLYSFQVRGSWMRRKTFLAGPHVDFLTLPSWLPLTCLTGVEFYGFRATYNDSTFCEAELIVEV